MGTRVYVGRLSYDVRERDLEKFFKGYGRVREILLKNGFGFVEFDDYRDADDAVYELNGKDLLGERVVLEHARGPSRRAGNSFTRRRGGWMDKGMSRDQSRSDKRYGPPTRTDYRVIVENLSSRVSWQDLKDFMRAAGEVTYADAHKQHRNEGVVEFSTRSDMHNAIDKLNGTELSGRKIKIVEDRHRRRRSRTRSRSRSIRRSRSRSSSRSRSRSRSKSSSRSRSRSVTPPRVKSKSKSRDRKLSKSLSRSRSKSREKSVSKSPSRSRSKSKTPELNGDRSSDKETTDHREDD
jgi:arginine/serine-rich splicing factor 4/5/6